MTSDLRPTAGTAFPFDHDSAEAWPMQLAALLPSDDRLVVLEDTAPNDFGRPCCEAGDRLGRCVGLTPGGGSA